MRKTNIFLLSLGLCLSTTVLPGITGNQILAETLVVENTGQFYNKNKPQKGMSKAQVRKRFGEPQQSLNAVGNPPISRWRYAEFTVYFEHNHVIHAVNNRY